MNIQHIKISQMLSIVCLKGNLRNLKFILKKEKMSNNSLISTFETRDKEKNKIKANTIKH